MTDVEAPIRVGIQFHVTVRGKKLHCNCGQYKVGSLTKRIAIRPSIRKAEYRIYEYRYNPRHCLYELDEALPLPPSPATMAIAANIAKALNCNQKSEYHVQRKIITDGSLVAGFQRTGVFATGGEIDGIKIRELRLEEDSCRRVNSAWNVSRQGLPLIQITTEPFQYTDTLPDRLLKIGSIAKKYTSARGIGTIRQDLNVDAGLGKTQLKGVQDLDLVKKGVAFEAARQKKILLSLSGYHFSVTFLKSTLARVRLQGADTALLWVELADYLSRRNPGLYVLKNQLISFKEGFALSEFMSVLGLLCHKKWPTVRKLLTTGVSEYMRGLQTVDRYVREPVLRKIRTVRPTQKIRQSREQKLLKEFQGAVASILSSMFFALKPLGYVRYAIVKRVSARVEQGVLSRYQIPWVTKKLLEGLTLNRILASPEIAPLTVDDLRSIRKLHNATSKAALQLTILQKHRQKVRDLDSLIQLINSSWEESVT